MVSLNENKKFIKIAKEVINLEIKALNKQKRNINDSFYLAVEQILKCQFIILCGVEKSGLIANKIASTLSSVGTPLSISQQVTHPMVTWAVFQKDILILISNR